MESVKLGDKLHVVVCGDLAAGPQGCQAIHAAIAFTFEHPEICGEWHRDSNYLASLSMRDERALNAHREGRGAGFPLFGVPRARLWQQNHGSRFRAGDVQNLPWSSVGSISFNGIQVA